MRVRDLGSTVRVTVSADYVSNWNTRWPCSSLRGAHAFEFERKNGDLVDHTGRGDGSEAVALSEDAWKFACRKLGIESNR